MNRQLQQAIQQKLSIEASPDEAFSFHAIGGGSINATYRVALSQSKAFCKINSTIKFPNLFQKEAAGLALINKQSVIAVPSLIACFEEEQQQILLLEWINEGERTDRFWKTFGQQLAALHQVTNKSFGLNEDNYMGSVPQQNTPCTNWIEFFIHQRLEPMIKRCLSKNLLTTRHLSQAEKLYDRLASIFDESEPPSLLHGDLWSGNFMCDSNNQPVLIDPAVYYGHRSMDLAMTTLFGGFRQPFYEAYNYHFSLPKNYKEQWAVCNLYPLFIHLYLFGSGYLSSIKTTLDQFN